MTIKKVHKIMENATCGNKAGGFTLTWNSIAM